MKRHKVVEFRVDIADLRISDMWNHYGCNLLQKTWGGFFICVARCAERVTEASHKA